MKKRLASGYTFVAAAKTVAHADFSDITLAGIQLIVNVTDQIVIYNFADSAKGGTLATDTLTLEYDTASMSDTDELMILVEDGVAGAGVALTGNNNAIWKDDSGFGENVTSGVGAVHGRLWDGAGYDRQPGNSTDGALVNLGSNNDVVAAGDVASGSADSGNPVKVGAKYNSTRPTFTDGQRGDLQLGTRGSLGVSMFLSDSVTPVAVAVTNADGVAAGAVASRLEVINRNSVYNGSTWDRMSGDTTGINVKAIVGSLPAGTAAIGKLAANSGVDIGDVTLTAGTAAIGTLLPPDIDVTTHTNYAKKYYTNAGAVTDGIVWSPAAGKRWHVVSLFIQVSAAATVTLEDDKAGGDEAVMKMELAANSGISIPFPEKYPLASGEDAADLIITTSAGNVYVTCVGYEI